MCTVCGCDGDGAKIDAGDKQSAHDHSHHHDHAHDHEHGHAHGHDHSHGEERAPDALHFGSGAAGASVPGVADGDLVAIERRVLSKNDEIAAENRRRFEADGVVAINLMSSPGAGKTTLLVETINVLKDEFPVAVIEGDQQTSNDAARIRETGVPAVQVNTGKGCHLDAEMVRDAYAALPSPAGGFLFIENVGNLVCPASFDLGEARRAVLASVTEGEDKPLKYPDIFASANLLVVTKTDLFPHLRFDVAALVDNARRVRPNLDYVATSVEAAPGLGYWLAWLRSEAGVRREAAE
ncbi:MAG: hydrogenase nickel incorporation protein HypB [Pseudomonadota bacterium]